MTRKSFRTAKVCKRTLHLITDAQLTVWHVNLYTCILFYQYFITSDYVCCMLLKTVSYSIFGFLSIRLANVCVRARILRFETEARFSLNRSNSHGRVASCVTLLSSLQTQLLCNFMQLTMDGSHPPMTVQSPTI